MQISGTGHKLLGPEAGQTDHWRIILTEEDKKATSYSERHIKNGDIPCLFLHEYKARYVDKYLNQQPKSISKDDPVNFLNRHSKVRTLDELSFRLLNYILYSHLFFANILGFLSDEDLNKYTHGEFTCLRLIEKNYEIIQTILAEKEINNVKSFMNIVFDKMIEIMKNVGDMNTIEKREKFETEIKNYLEQLITNKEELYNSEEAKYNEYNEKIKGSDPKSIIEIISENYSPFGDIYYDPKDYPDLGLFLVSKYPDLTEMETNLGKTKDYTINYCLLNQVLIGNEDYSLIQNVVNINKLVNLLYNKYNNKIERDKAKSKKLLECFDQNDKIEDIKNDIIIPYINSWNKIKHKCTNYLCRPTMPELNVTMEHTLNHFLPDDGELYGGMYLASAYKFFIDTQNELVRNIIKSIGPNSLLRSYLSQLSQEIHVQDANEEDIIKINEDTKKFTRGMIFQYSMRDIFKNGAIDFKEFKKSIKFDFASIENELARIILPGVKLFISNEANEPIKFISYLYETFRSSRSSIITNYNIKYPPRKLTEEEEKLLYSFIKEKKNKKQNFIIDIMSSCQLLIDYIQKENFNRNRTILSVIKDLPRYIEIDEFLKSFFIENTEDTNEINTVTTNQENIQMFSINTLINFYELIEFLCWDEFKNNLNDQYKMHLTEEMKKSIKRCIDSNITEEKLIKKQDIANATRRLISRYLSGKRGDTDIDEFKILFDYIKRGDLWKSEFMNDDRFETEIYLIFEEIKKETKFILKCGAEFICDNCNKMKAENGLEDPCPMCNNCYGGLRVGQAMEFYELINDEVLDLDRYNRRNEINVQNNEINTDENINNNAENIAEGQNEERANIQDDGDNILEQEENLDREPNDNDFPESDDDGLGPI